MPVTQNADGRLEVFAIGTDSSLLHIWQTAPNNGWSNWESLGGSIKYPAVIRNADGRLEVFGIGTDDGLWHIWQTAPGIGWSAWTPMGGDLREYPCSVCMNQDGRLEVFALGKDWRIWLRSQIGLLGAWIAWMPLGDLQVFPFVAINACGYLHVFAQGYSNTGQSDLRIWHIRQPLVNNGWSDWEVLGENFRVSGLSVALNADSRLEVFAENLAYGTQHVWQTAPNGPWSAWASIDGPGSVLSFGRNLDGRLDVFFPGNSELWQRWQTAPSNGWSGWASLGGQLAQPPPKVIVDNNADGRLEVFGMGTDSRLKHIWQTAPNNGWSGWEPLGDWEIREL